MSNIEKAPVAGPLSTAAPSFLKGHVADESTKSLQQYVIMPRLKVLQAQSNARLVEKFGAGAVLCMPDETPVIDLIYEGAKLNLSAIEPIRFNPIYFYPEYIRWNKELGVEQPIISRSRDRRSEVAIKSQNAATREERLDSGITVLNVEHLNWIGRILNGPAAGSVVALSFARGEWRTGSRLSGLITARKGADGSTPPMCACVFELALSQRVKTSYRWYGLEPTNPVEPANAWIQDEAVFADNLALAKTWNELGAQLQVMMDDEATEIRTVEGTVVSPEDESKV